MSTKTKAKAYDWRGHDQVREVLDGEFTIAVSPKGDYFRLLKDGKLAGWGRAGIKHVRLYVGPGPKDAHNVATVAQAKAVVTKLDAQVAS